MVKGSPQPSGARRRPPLGLRRIRWVLVTVGQGRPRCEVAGISNRLPVVRAVGLHTASALVADGVPLVVRHLRSDDPTTPPPSPDAAVVATRSAARG